MLRRLIPGLALATLACGAHETTAGSPLRPAPEHLRAPVANAEDSDDRRNVCPPAPRTPWEILDKRIAALGVIEGDVARAMAADDISERLANDTEKVTTRIQDNGHEVVITEVRLAGVLVQLDVAASVREDPLAEVATDEIRKVVYGQHAHEEVVAITDPQKISAIVEALRCHCHRVHEASAYRPYRGTDGTVAHLLMPVKGVGFVNLCSLGLWFHLRDGRIVNVDGHAHLGHITGCDEDDALKNVLSRFLGRVGGQR